MRRPFLGARTFCLGAFIVSLLFLIGPRLNGFTATHVHKEDGFIFLRDWAHLGTGSILETYTGYLHVLPRLITALVAGVLPPEQFALGVAVMVAVVRIWFAIVTLWVFKSRGLSVRVSWLGAAVFIVTPVGGYEVLGNLTNLRWFCDAILVIGVLDRSPRLARKILIAVTLFFAALSDPLSLVLAPVALGVAWTERKRVLNAVAAGGALLGALVQFAFLNPSARAAFWHAWLQAPVELAGQFVVRGPVAAQYGITVPELVFKVGGFLGPLFLALLPLALLWVGRTRTVGYLVGLSAYLLAWTIIFASPGDISVLHWWGIAQPSRYNLAPAVLLGVAGILAADQALKSRRHAASKTATTWLVFLSAAAFLAGILADMRGDSVNTDGPQWGKTVVDARAQCEKGGQKSVPVQFTPSRPTNQWKAPLDCSWFDR